MGQSILNIRHGDHNAELQTTERGNVALQLGVTSTSIHGGQSISMELSEPEARSLAAALKVYIASRETKFDIGDIVYEPKHYKRAGKVIQILQDRLYYGAPYRIQFIDQDPNQPETDYFPADGLVLVQKAAFGA